MRKSKIALLALVLLVSLIPILPFNVEAQNLVTEDERWVSYNLRISESIYFIMVEMNAPLVVGQHDLFRSEDSGETWENMGCITETYGSNESISAASMAVDTLDNNLVHITWQSYAGSHFIQKTIWNNTAEAFQQNVEVVAQRGYIHWMEIDSNNVLHIAWDDMTTDASVTAHAKYRNSTDRGDNWNAIATLDSNSWGDWFINLQLLVTRNNVVNVAWRENDPGAKNHRYMYCRRFTNLTWVAAEDTAGSWDSTAPAGGWDWSSDPEDRLIRTYHNGSSGFSPITGADIYVGYTTEATNYTGALAWSEPTAIGSGKVFIQDPSIQVDDSGAAHIICQEWLDGWAVGDFPNPVPGNISLHYMREDAFPWNSWQSPIRLNFWHSQCGFGFFRGSQYPLINRVDSTATLDFMFMVWQGVSAEYDIYYQLLSLIVSVSGSITDMEGCGNWIFAETEYYSFVGNATLLNAYLDVMQMRFSDGYNTIQFYFKNSTTDYIGVIGDSGTFIHLRLGSVESGDSWVSVTFQVYLTQRIIDALDVDLWMNANTTTGDEIGWTEVQHDYFHIYNFGGFTEFETGGNAGRLSGGEAYDLYAYNNSWVEMNTTYRNLVHIKMLPIFRFELLSVNPSRLLDYRFYYCTSEDDEFLNGMRLRIGWWNSSTNPRYTCFQVVWYSNFQGGWLQDKIDYVFAFQYDEAYANTNQTIQFWVDMWLNKENASSVIAGRMNAYYQPIQDASLDWLRWFTGSNWGLYPIRKQSNYATTILDDDGNIVHAQQIRLEKIYIGISQSIVMAADPLFTVSEYDIFDLTFDHIEPLTGMATPSFDETRMPQIAQGGFLGFLGSTFGNIVGDLSALFGPAILGFWNTFVNFLDTIAAAVGLPNLFTNMITWLNNLWSYVATYITDLFTFLTSLFLIWMEGGYKAISTFSQMATYWILMFQETLYILDTGYGSAVGLWEELNLTAWLILFAILYPVILLGIWEEEGFNVMLNHIQFIINMITFVVHGLITITMFFMNVVHYIIESIPVVE